MITLRASVALLVAAVVLSSCGSAFDATVPDTQNNKNYYEKLLNVKWSPDVSKLYAWENEADLPGSLIEKKLSFTCDRATAERIIAANKLKKLRIRPETRVEWKHSVETYNYDGPEWAKNYPGDGYEIYMYRDGDLSLNFTYSPTGGEARYDLYDG